jgi:hypothetical protein
VRNCSVYEVNEIEVPNEAVISHGLNEGQRSRVIALALELKRSLGASVTQATCIADRDFADFIGESFDAACLLLTDYCCLEMYLFTEVVFERFVGLYFPESEVAASQLRQRIAEVAQELFQLRLANHLLELGLSFQEFSLEKFLRLAGERIAFDRGKYIIALLHKHNMASCRNEFDNKIGEYSSRMKPDPRHQMNGHDMIRVCAWYVSKNFPQKRQAIGDFDVIARSLRLCVVYEDLKSEVLFRAILERVNS